MSTLSKESQALVDTLLEGDTAERKEVLAALPILPDKESIAVFLIEHLPKEQDGWARAWSISNCCATTRPISTPSARDAFPIRPRPVISAAVLKFPGSTSSKKSSMRPA